MIRPTTAFLLPVKCTGSFVSLCFKEHCTLRSTWVLEAVTKLVSESVFLALYMLVVEPRVFLKLQLPYLGIRSSQRQRQRHVVAGTRLGIAL